MQNGVTVEPTDHKAVSAAILEIILNKDGRWTRYSASGIRNILAYSWPSHCIKYLDHIETLISHESAKTAPHKLARGGGRHSMDYVGAAMHDLLEGTPGSGGRAKVCRVQSAILCFHSAIPHGPAVVFYLPWHTCMRAPLVCRF
jgi:hypothetical protein